MKKYWITALSVFVKLLFFGEYTQNKMPTSKIKMKKLAHYFLAIIATAGEIISNPQIRSSCSGGTIETEKLKIEETPVNFRNLTGSEDEKQIFMQLEVSEVLRNCMDNNKFNLTMDLDKPFSKDEVKIGSTATEHIITIDQNHISIESCNFDENQVSDQQFILLNFQQLANKKTDEGDFQELIFFTMPSVIGEITKNIESIRIDFEGLNQKKTCETYRGFL